MADRKPQPAILIPSSDALIRDIFVAVVSGLVVAWIVKKR